MSSIKTMNVQNDKVCHGSQTVTRLQYLRVHPHFLLVSNGSLYFVWEPLRYLHKTTENNENESSHREGEQCLQCCCRRVWWYEALYDTKMGHFHYFHIVSLFRLGHGQPANCEIFYILCCCSIQFYKTFQKFTNSGWLAASTSGHDLQMLGAGQALNSSHVTIWMLGLLRRLQFPQTRKYRIYSG